MNSEEQLKKALPDYDNCLVNLSNSILLKYGAPTSAGTLKLADEYLKKDRKNVVLLLLDAMGITILEKHLRKDGFFRSNLKGSYSSVYPPTTVAATTSLMSGLYPNEHGWLGWDCYFPQIDKNVSVFLNTEQKTEKTDYRPPVDEDGNEIWDEDSLNEKVPAAEYNAAFRFCPYKNIIDKINEAGTNAYFSMPFMPPFPQDLESILDRITELCRKPGKKFIYSYWNEPDSTMHRTGTVSDETHEMVRSLEKRIEKLSSELEDTLLIITADHGHIDCDNYCLLDYPDIMECFRRLPSIEPRTVSMFIKDEYKDSFPDLFRKHFGDGFELYTREEVLSSRLFGTGNDHERLGDMIGDIVAVSVTGASLFTTHVEAKLMPGGHAGATSAEMIIPFIVVDKK